MRTAAIGIGSNSLRMLIADIKDGQLLRLRRFREGLRVFAALNEDGCILPDMVQSACEHILQFKQEALAQGTEHVHLFATSAVRDAANQQAFMEAIKQATDLETEICSGELEAKLSFVGATDGDEAGLIDIGGGSTEIAVGKGFDVRDAVSLQMGAVRLFRMQGIGNAEDAFKVVELARSILSPERERFASQHAESWVGVGGTFTTCAALVQNIPWEQRENIHGYTLKREDVKASLLRLADMPMQDRMQMPCMQPHRADIVAHGIAILVALMEDLGIPQITVSEYGNLEGYLKMKYIYTA